jgi:O-acetyl-ADP-ribose deacetylase (regulator of RNase III)
MSILVSAYQTEWLHSIEVRQGDLTAEDTGAIVNAANSHLAHGGGVAGAIVARGGRAIQVESSRWVAEHGPVPTGQVAVTGAGSLSARAVIHAVGPVWQGGGTGEDDLLRSAVWNSLAKAEEMRLASIALPAISSGISGFPKDRCAAILVRTALQFCANHRESHLREIRFTNIDRQTVDLFEAELGRLTEGHGRRG